MHIAPNKSLAFGHLKKTTSKNTKKAMTQPVQNGTIPANVICYYHSIFEASFLDKYPYLNQLKFNSKFKKGLRFNDFVCCCLKTHSIIGDFDVSG